MSDKVRANKKPSALTPNDQQEFLDTCDRLSEFEARTIRELVPIKKYKKGEILLREGEIPDKCFYIIQGCVRQYYLIDGEEKTTNFYTEDQSIHSLPGTSNRLPSKHYLACVEDCTLTVCTRAIENEMYRRFPRFETMCRIALEEELCTYQEMLANYITSSPIQRYKNLLKNRPELVERVPQYQLASYLGVTPESFSRIKKRMLKKA